MGQEGNVLSQITAGKVLFAALVIIGTLVLLRWVRGLFNRLETGNPRLRFLARQVEPPLRIVVWFGALMMAANVVAPSKDAFLAALGSAALAIGLGLQDLIKNLIGGLVIVTDRPYQSGDRIRVGEANGEVVQIGLRSTKIVTPRGVLVTIPNSDVLTQFTHNANAGVPECVVTTDVSIPQGADPDVVLEIASEVAVACPFTHLGRRIEVELDDKGTGWQFMKVSIQAYAYDHRYAEAMRTDMLRRAKREFLARKLIRAWDPTVWDKPDDRKG